jgi:hypothetical protein
LNPSQRVTAPLQPVASLSQSVAEDDKLDRLDRALGPFWYGLDHKPISLTEAAELLADGDARRVASTYLPRPDGTYAYVSTVFLGYDAEAWRVGPPVLYETMVFGGPGDLATYRHRTRSDAEEWHRAVSALWMPGRADLARHRSAVKSMHIRARRRARRVRHAQRRDAHRLRTVDHVV